MKKVQSTVNDLLSQNLTSCLLRGKGKKCYRRRDLINLQVRLSAASILILCPPTHPFIRFYSAAPRRTHSVWDSAHHEWSIL